MQGFFPSSVLRGKRPAVVSAIPKCGLCKQHKTCQSPKMKVYGKGEKGVMLVGSWPETEDDKKGKPFTNDVGSFLRKLLRQKGVDLYRDCWTTYAMRCRLSGEADTKLTVECCRPSLLDSIKKLKPKVIILFGIHPARSLIQHLWKEDIGSINTWRGFIIPDMTYNAWVAPLDVPAYVARKDDAPLRKYFRNTLHAALKKKTRPYKTIPNYLEQVRVITNPAKAAKRIRRFIKWGGRLAFDFEGNTLKPECRGAHLLSCSICREGEETIAYPLRAEAKQATADILKSDLLKIGQNIKFEHRWARDVLKVRTRHWLWDTMLAAHDIDNRPSVTGLKFMAYTMLGAPSYDDHIKPFLSTKGKSRINRVEEIDERDLLLYNGLDSLYTYKIAMKQMAILERRHK